MSAKKILLGVVIGAALTSFRPGNLIQEYDMFTSHPTEVQQIGENIEHLKVNKSTWAIIDKTVLTAHPETREILYEALVWSRMAKNQLPRSHLEELTDKAQLYQAEREGRAPIVLRWYNRGSLPTQKEKAEHHREWNPYILKLDHFLREAGLEYKGPIQEIPKEIAESAKNKARLYWCKSPTGPEELKEDICP